MAGDDGGAAVWQERVRQWDEAEAGPTEKEKT